MKLALLGADPDALLLARAAARDRQHDLVWVDASVPAEALGQFAPATLRAESWEVLLTGTVADAVIVGRGPDGEVRADQLRKLVQARVPLLITHPVVDSMLIYYELEMIREETGCPVLPYLPARWHPGFQRLNDLVTAWREATGQPPEQLVFERQLTDRGREAVLRQFQLDCDLARALCGELTKVGALGPLAPATNFANLGVQLSNPEGVLVRWSVAPAETAAAGKLTVISPAGTATLSMPHDEQAWQLQRSGEGGPQAETFANFDPAAAALKRMEDLIGGVTVQPDWMDAARTVELAEGVERSLLKGRTVEIHNQEHSEQGTFKGLMTSVGCGLLLISLLVVLAAAIASGLGIQQFRIWPYLLLAILGVFLLLQLLQLAFPREE